MSAYDISRFSHDPRKHYHSVRMQQGRVLTDDDWNENERIESEEQRRTLTEVIGPFGSPDAGFKIANARIDEGAINFDVLPGTVHLGGLRLEMDPVLSPDGVSAYETFQTQRDWLQLDLSQFPAPTAADLDQADRFDFVYLHAWQQPVSAVEDTELFEVALGGPDTTTRIRHMRRVHLADNLGATECHEAWRLLTNRWQSQNLGEISPAHELVPNTTLTVGYSTEGEAEDLCTPSVEGGYLGADNQAIRVQLVDDSHFTWGFDNAAPLYRIEASGGDVTMLTLPKDQYHWPLAGQIVEIIPWSAVLPNGEIVAETRGHLSRVETSYNPDDQTLTLSAPIPAGFGLNWTSRSDAGAIGTVGEVPAYYMRVWNRGAGDTSDPAIPITVGTAQTLGTTGVSVTFNGTDYQADDHWVIAVRPETRNQVVPWALDTGVAPHGIRRFFAPLAIIQWTVVDQEVVGRVIRDCRKIFQPLTDLESCCTYHVGDGVNSHGDFNSIEEALQNLPDEGGKICVLPGEHFANVDILNRTDIHIHGCGDRSIVIPHEDQLDQPIIRIASSQNITIDHLHLATTGGTAIHLQDPEEGEPSTNISLTHNHIMGFEYGIYVEANDSTRGQNNFHIAYNQIAMIEHDEGLHGIFCLADGVLIERNKLVVIPPPNPDDPSDPREDPDDPGGVYDPCADDNGNGFYNGRFKWTTYLRGFFLYAYRVFTASQNAVYQTLGGIQIGGTSEDVRIIDNEIIGGAGNGITLGHIPEIDLPPVPTVRNPGDPVILATPATYQPYVGERNADGQVYNVQGARLTSGKTASLNNAAIADSFQAELADAFNSYLYEIHIERNRISSMGLAGVGVVAFFDPESEDSGLVVHVENLTIYRNHISFCAQQIPTTIPDNMQNQIGFGGIALASCEYAAIRENRIERNGRSFIEPVCGVFILNGEDVELSNNHILDNGPRTSLTGESLGLTAQARPGARGGIFIAMSFKRQFREAIVEEVLSDGVPAVKVHDNIIVQPLGQALYVVAFGPVTVVGNQFTSHEIDFGAPSSVLAGAVAILNLGISKDILRLAAIPPLIKLSNMELSDNVQANFVQSVQLISALLQYLPSGSVLFANNQTTLDLRNLEIDLALSSQLILSLDDIGFHGNQSEVKGLAFINRETDNLQPLDLVLTNSFLLGMTLRTTQNRFQEGFTRTFYSLLSIGLVNTTTSNQSSNCMLTYGTQEEFANNIQGILLGFDCNDERGEIGGLTGLSGADTRYKSGYVSNANLQLPLNTLG